MSEQQVQNDRKFITLNEKLEVQVMSKSDKHREMSHCFQAKWSSNKRLNQGTLSDREGFPFRHQQVFGTN